MRWCTRHWISLQARGNDQGSSQGPHIILDIVHVTVHIHVTVHVTVHIPKIYGLYVHVCTLHYYNKDMVQARAWERGYW